MIASLYFITFYSNVATCKWGTAYPILQKIIDIETTTTTIDNNNDHGEYILIGTIYKEMSLRGSVLDEFKENNGITGECDVADWLTDEADDADDRQPLALYHMSITFL